MNARHSIRLAGPWQRRVLSVPAGGTANSETVTVRMPCSVAEDLGATFQGRVEYQRFFNRPTNIDTETNLALVCDHLMGRHVEFLLNGELLQSEAAIQGVYRLDLQGRLESRNELQIRFDVAPVQEETDESQTGLEGAVRLEIG